MQYLVLSVMPYGIPLRVEGQPPRTSWPVDVSSSLEEALIDWNERLTHIIANNDLHPETELQQLRAALNEEGVQLAKQLQDELAGQAKITYLPE